MFDFKTSLAASQDRLNDVIKFQDPIYGLHSSTLNA
jgi:hypothetical protein